MPTPSDLPLLFIGNPGPCVEALAAARRGGPVEAQLAADAGSVQAALGGDDVAARWRAAVIVSDAELPTAALAALVPASLPLLVVGDALPPGVAGRSVSLADLAGGAATGPPLDPETAGAPAISLGGGGKGFAGPADAPLPTPADRPPAASASAPPPASQAPVLQPLAPATPAMFDFLRRESADAPDSPEPREEPGQEPREERPAARGPAPMSPVSPLVAETTSRAPVAPPPAPPATADPTVIVRPQPTNDPLDLPGMDRHAEDATVVSDGEAQPAILVVEDNNDTRMLLERILRSTYDVTAVADARSALLAMNQQRFAGLVLDINLGGRETGADVLRIARSLPNYDGVFAIALTAYALPGDRERLLEAGFNEYISKPFTRQSLMECLKAGVRA